MRKGRNEQPGLRSCLVKEKTQRILFACIVIAFFVTRIFRLGRTPAGINIDELGSAYDAMCIGRHGVDRYLTKMPPYFKNYGGGQSALIIYLGAILLRFSSFSLFCFRLIPVILGAAALLCAYLLGREVFERKEFALIAPALMVVMPEFLMTERWGLDCNLFLSMSVIVFFFLMKAMRSEGLKWYLLSGLVCGITLYTYVMSYLVMPVFLLGMLILLIYTGKIRWKQAVSFCLPLMVLAFPLVLEQLVNAGLIGEIHTPFMDFIPMGYYRGGEFSLGNVVRNIPWIWRILIGDNQSYASCLYTGTILYLSIPFFLMGLVICLKKTMGDLKEKKAGLPFMLLLFYLSSLLILLTVKNMNVSHANQIFAPILIFTAYGIAYVWDKTNRAAVGIAVLYGLFFLGFAAWYYGGSYNRQIRESEENYLFVKTDLGQAVRQMDEMFAGDKPVVIMANEAEDSRLLLALYNDISPYEYAKNSVRTGNYIIEIPEELDISGESAYVIARNLHHVTDYLGSIGFTVDDMSYPDYSLVYK